MLALVKLRTLSVRFPPTADISDVRQAPCMRTPFAVMMVVACVGCVTAPDPAKFAGDRIPVEVWTGGDDGLTLRLADAVRSEFKQSARYTEAASSTANALRVTIPTHVRSDDVDGRARVTYSVRFDRAERRIGETNGTCWSDELNACARLVLEQATHAANH